MSGSEMVVVALCGAIFVVYVAAILFSEERDD